MKIFIVSSNHINKLDVANEIVALNDDLNICKSFTSTMASGLIGEYMFNLDIDDIILSFKNNALLYIDYSDENVCGITLDDFNASDIVMISPEHFNSIPDDPISLNELVIIWLDSKFKSPNYKKDIIEVKYLQERIDNLSIPALYFCDEDKSTIAKTVLDYILADETTREEIILENS